MEPPIRTLQWSAKPAITTDLELMIASGQATLTVGVGTPLLTYQWYSDERTTTAPISGAGACSQPRP